jgi:hypothetical protein
MKSSMLAMSGWVSAIAIAAASSMLVLSSAQAQDEGTRVVPRHPGTMSAGPVNELTYTPTCPVYALTIDVSAIDEAPNTAAGRALLQRLEEELLSSGDRFDDYMTCVDENTRVDIERIGQAMEASRTRTSDGEVAQYNAIATAGQAALQRVQASAAAAPPRQTGNNRRNRNAGTPPPAPAAAPVRTFATGFTPLGPDERRYGSLSFDGGAPTYTPPCVYTFQVTAADFNAVTAPAEFTTLNNALNVQREELIQAMYCRNGVPRMRQQTGPTGQPIVGADGQPVMEQVREPILDGAGNPVMGADGRPAMSVVLEREGEVARDYATIQERINTGRRAVLEPALAAYQQRYGFIQSRLNLQKQPGGVLAPPEAAPRPAAPRTPAPAPRRRPS